MKGRECGVDFTSHSAAGTLAVQVTRVPRDQSRWERIQREGRVAVVADIPTAAQELFEAIRHKGDKSRPQGNADVTLVLDGASSPVHILQNTLDRFEQEFGARASAFGFASIWLVTAAQIVCLAGG